MMISQSIQLLQISLMGKPHEINGIQLFHLNHCVGGGHIANAINDFYTTKREITGMDLVDRGYPGTIVADFLTYKTDKKYEGIITNPPYSLAKEFVEKGMQDYILEK